MPVTEFYGRVSVAPMMDWTDRHCRYFLRGFSPDILLYTEMLTASAILRGDRDWLLRFHPAEHPVALQLGGCEPEYLYRASLHGLEAGYDELNLNCGCPSDKVQKGAFGACLMSEPELVAECVSAMREAADEFDAERRIPVTVKMRVGTVRGNDAGLNQRIADFTPQDYEALQDFASAVVGAGCDSLIVHARKAVLGKDWSPKDNREIPPLRYDVVRRLKEDFPQIPVVVNGGYRLAADVVEALLWADGVMLGREAYHRPMVLAETELALGHRQSLPRVADLLERMARYAEEEMSRGERLQAITRHMLGLVTHTAGAREFRRLLSEGARAPGAGPQLIREAARLAA